MENGQGPVTAAEITLTGKQRKFADFYCGECNLNATRAAEKAGYKGSLNALAVIGHENLRKPNIRAYINKRLDELTATPSEILTILTRHAKGSLADVLDENGEFNLADAKKRGVDGLLKKLKVRKTVDPVTKEFEYAYEYEIHDPKAAAVELGKIHKLYTDKIEVSGPDGKPLNFVTNVTLEFTNDINGDSPETETAG